MSNAMEFKRIKAIKAVAQGAVKAQLCKTLNINRNTLDLWIKQYLETDSFAPRSYHHQRRKPKLKIWISLRILCLKTVIRPKHNWQNYGEII